MALSIHQSNYKRLKNVQRYGSRAAKAFIRHNGAMTVADLIANLKARAYRSNTQG